MYLGKQIKRYQVIPLNHSLETSLPSKATETPPSGSSKSTTKPSQLDKLKALLNL